MILLARVSDISFCDLMIILPFDNHYFDILNPPPNFGCHTGVNMRAIADHVPAVEAPPRFFRPTVQAVVVAASQPHAESISRRRA